MFRPWFAFQAPERQHRRPLRAAEATGHSHRRARSLGAVSQAGAVNRFLGCGVVGALGALSF